MRALWSGSGAMLRVQACVGAPGAELVVVVQALEFVPPVQTLVVVVTIPPVVVVQISVVVVPVITVRQTVPAVPAGVPVPRIGASTMAVGRIMPPVARSTCEITPGLRASGAVVK